MNNGGPVAAVWGWVWVAVMTMTVVSAPLYLTATYLTCDLHKMSTVPTVDWVLLGFGESK